MTNENDENVIVIDSLPANNIPSQVSVDISGWSQQMKTSVAAGTATFPSYDAGVAEDRNFCSHCGHPLIRGKVVGREYSPSSGLMRGRWSMFGCETQKRYLKRPRLLKLLSKLRFKSKHEIGVVTEKFSENSETWEHWSNISLEYWIKNGATARW